MKRKHTGTDPRKVLNSGRAEYHPACFESAEQYRDWVFLNRQAVHSHDTHYCLDCTPEYKEKMLSQGRCAHPETRFVIWRHNRLLEIEVIGVSSDSHLWPRVVKGEVIFNWGDTSEQDKQQS